MIFRYDRMQRNEKLLFVEFILPAYKPELTSDDTIEYVGVIADLLGFPIAALLTRVYVSKEDLEINLKQDEKGTIEAAAIIADISYILGFDLVETIANIVQSTESIQSSLQGDGGAYELKDGTGAIQDCIDLLKDYL